MVKRLGFLVIVIQAACGEAAPNPQPDGPSFSTRDSAGVEIVESTRPRWGDNHAWLLSSRPLFTIQGSDGRQENLLLDPVSIDVDSRGRIVIGDGNQVGWHAILVYDSLGEFLFKAGGPGQGPGEYGQLWWASAYRGDSLVAFDMATDRVRVFDPEGRYVRQVDTPPSMATRGAASYVPGMNAAYHDGHFLAYPRGSLDIDGGVGAAWFRHPLLRLSPDGSSWDSLGVFEIFETYWDGTRSQPFWYGGIAASAVGSDELYFGRGRAFEIERLDAGGRLTRIMRRPFVPTPVTEKDKDRALDWFLEMARSSREGAAAPEQVRRQLASTRSSETKPPYSYMLLDDFGNLWVEHYQWIPYIERSPFDGQATWSVFDTAGVWLVDVEMPARFILRDVTRDRALGFRVDELGVKEAEVYRLERSVP